MASRKIYFVHEDKAAYPEIAAYRSFLRDEYICEETTPDELLQKEDLASAVCWMMMGHYPQKLKARLVIHDYRSLSVGAGRWFKDKIKRYTNATPDLRIFQNKEMAAVMGFKDSVSTLYIPMGVPSFIKDVAQQSPAEKNCDFCYIGVMSEERNTHLMFDSFLKRFGAIKTFHAYGVPEEAIVQRYKDHSNIIFAGRHPQEEVFAALKQAHVAVNYFPAHYPHALQTPTKLLEYGALGTRVLCNEQAQSRLTAEKYGLNCLWGAPKDMFQSVPDDLNWPDNDGFDPTPMLWTSVLTSSGLATQLQEALKKK